LLQLFIVSDIAAEMFVLFFEPVKFYL